jgi:hypothetical protein
MIPDICITHFPFKISRADSSYDCLSIGYKPNACMWHIAERLARVCKNNRYWTWRPPRLSG